MLGVGVGVGVAELMEVSNAGVSNADCVSKDLLLDAKGKADSRSEAKGGAVSSSKGCISSKVGILVSAKGQ